MCCEDERKLFSKKMTKSVKSREKKKGSEQKGVVEPVPMDNCRKRRFVVSEHSDDANASAPAAPSPDRSNLRVQSKRTKLVQRNINDLSLDDLFCVVCKLGHDDLNSLSLVSKTFREAVSIARQVHFDFSTPPPTRVWKPLNPVNGHADSTNCRFWPATPDAPRRTRKSRRLVTDEEISEVAVHLSSLFGGDETDSDSSRVTNTNR